MLRELWRSRRLIAAITIVLGGLATTVAWFMPSYYQAEARILVGVNAPRVLSSEAIITDAKPDAERVQSESFVVQSRILAKLVIDKLKLIEDPYFNAELVKPPSWPRPASGIPATSKGGASVSAGSRPIPPC